MRKPKQQTKPLNDLSRSLTPFDPNQTSIAVLELSNESWLVAGIIPGVERQPLKKLEPDENELFKLRVEQLKRAPKVGANLMVLLLVRVIGIGIDTADMLVNEVLSRNLRDRRAVARYAGLTGSPDESGKRRREKGLARSGKAWVRRGMIQLAWRFLEFQKDSGLVKWFRARTENAPRLRKKMIVAMARKLLIALWQLVRDGVVPEGVVLRSAH